MLAMNEDDDEHMCIKCNATIIGLDNYVQHRKSLCKKIKKAPDKECNQGADVFFQSLQLQSSVKRPVSAVSSVPSSSKAGAGVLTRRATAAILATSKDIYSTIDPDPSIVSNKRGEDWIGGHSLKVTECDDNQTKLIKAVANISGSSKKEITTPTFTLLDEFKHDDDSNDDTDELDDMEEDDHQQTGGKWKPIAPHTTAKWKPIYSERDSATHWTSVTAITPEPDHLDDWEDEHTGGKWKPFMNQVPMVRLDKLHDIDDDEDDVYMPPPGHTKGKWIPGAKDGLKTDYKAHIMDATAMHKEGGAVMYWCGPCNRRLGSKIVYERHLMSKLHLKRVLPEKDLEFSGTFKTERLDIETPKRTIKMSSYLDEYVCMSPKKLSKSDKNEGTGIKKRRKRQPTFMICLVCKHRVKPFLLGKHLISHYHFRKSDLNEQFTKIQILENIHKIIRQSPFQCDPCKFYANWQAEFMRHWRTKQHRETMECSPGRFWCSFCKFECETYEGISEHLTGDDHQEVIAAINRSIPIIIRKKTIISCPSCKEEFKYNIQLRRHAKFHCPMTASSTASDEYQGIAKCTLCSFSCKSKLGILRHMKRKHDKPVYHCSACSMQFFSKEEILKHRRQQAHRINEIELRREKGFEVKDITKSCPHCDTPRLKNVIELKKHIQEKHPNKFRSCPLCGMKFILPQGLVWHLRNKSCAFNTQDTSNDFADDQSLRCRYCPYETLSPLEFIYHQALHNELTGKDGKNRSRYSCPICSKSFDKYCLRLHLRRHLNERPHACTVCNAKFPRRANLHNHLKRVHRMNRQDDDGKEHDLPPKPYLCSICGASFSKKFTLQQHATTHAGRDYPCDVPGCLYKARNRSELNLHGATHSESRPFNCSECGYSAKTKHQLTRHKTIHSDDGPVIKCNLCKFSTNKRAYFKKHFRLHADTRLFACRYCSYSCNRLENLRKHVLSRTIHKNLHLYECEYCLPEKYGTNFAKEFRAHLTAQHNSLYPDHKSTVFYVTEYLKEDRGGEFNSDHDSMDKLQNNESASFIRTEETDDGESKAFMQSDNVAILDDFPTEGCYSVAENGKLVPYLG